MRRLRGRLLSRDRFLWLMAASMALMVFTVSLAYLLQFGTARASEETARAANAGYRLSAQVETAEAAGVLRSAGLPEVGSSSGQAAVAGRQIPLTVLATTSGDVLAGYGTGPDARTALQAPSAAISRRAADLLDVEVGDRVTVTADGQPAVVATVIRVFSMPVYPQDTSLVLQQAPAPDMDLRWLYDDGALSQAQIGALGDDWSVPAFLDAAIRLPVG